MQSNILAVDNLTSQTRSGNIYCHILAGKRYRGSSLKVVKSIYAVARLTRTSLRRGANPLKFAAQEVAGLVDIGLHICVSLLAFFEELGVVATINEQLAAVQLKDCVTHAVQEVAVVGNHQ